MAIKDDASAEQWRILTSACTVALGFFYVKTSPWKGLMPLILLSRGGVNNQNFLAHCRSYLGMMQNEFIWKLIERWGAKSPSLVPSRDELKSGMTWCTKRKRLAKPLPLEGKLLFRVYQLIFLLTGESSCLNLGFLLLPHSLLENSIQQNAPNAPKRKSKAWSWGKYCSLFT